MLSPEICSGVQKEPVSLIHFYVMVNLTVNEKRMKRVVLDWDKEYQTMAVLNLIIDAVIQRAPVCPKGNWDLTWSCGMAMFLDQNLDLEYFCKQLS